MMLNPSASVFVPGVHQRGVKLLPNELLQVVCKELFASEYESSIHHVCPHKPYDPRPTVIGSIRNTNKELYYSAVDDFCSKQPVHYTFSWEQICEVATSGGELQDPILRGDEDKIQHVEFTIIVSYSSFLRYRCSWCTLKHYRTMYNKDPDSVAADWNRSVPLFKEHNDGNEGQTFILPISTVYNDTSLRKSKHSPPQKPHFPSLRTLTLRFVTQDPDSVWPNLA